MGKIEGALKKPDPCIVVNTSSFQAIYHKWELVRGPHSILNRIHNLALLLERVGERTAKTEMLRGCLSVLKEGCGENGPLEIYSGNSSVPQGQGTLFQIITLNYQLWRTVDYYNGSCQYSQL